jgi:hypothetical protein
VPIAYATYASYTAVAADVGFTLRSTVTASNVYGSTMASSAQTPTVSSALSAPANTVLPVISGVAQVGQVLTASTGTWVGTQPITYTFAWNRCNTTGGACSPIGGATAQTYTLTTADAGSTIRVTVTATNVVGSVSATSPQTSVVSAGGGGVGVELPPALPQSTGAVYYVATWGSGSNPGTDAAPWSLSWALGHLQAGQTALVHGGTYTANFLMNRSGSSTNPITVKNYPGETPTIHAGTGANCNDALQLYNSSYVRIQGFVVTGATGCDNNTNVYVAGNSSHVEVSSNEIAYGHDHGLFADPGTLDVQVLGNRLHDNGTVGSGNKDHEVYMEGTRQLIANNVIYNTPYGHAVQIYPDNDGTIIVDNTITNTHYTTGYRAAAIIVGSDVAGSSANNMKIVNNITAYNDYGIYGYQCGTASGSNNDAWNNDSWGNTYGNLVNDCNSEPVIDFSGGNLSADPMFVNRPNNDFHLQPGSPAVNVGLPAWSDTVDAGGVSRPQGVAPDLGAFER